MRRIKILLTFFLVSTAVFGQSVPLSKNAKVSVLTCGLGPEMYALFGHTAIRVQDIENSIDIVYNYGAFDFGTPNFALKFTKGDLQYFVTSGTYGDFIMQYNFEQRSVYEQELNLSLPQKQQLFDNLNQVLFSGERYYTYKFIDKNCTNMAVDIINKTLGGTVIYKQKDTTTTYRETLLPYFNGHFYEQLGTQILFGTKVDKPATTLFLPFEFKKNLDVTSYHGKPLAQQSRTLMEYPLQRSFSWWNNIYTLLLVVAVVMIADKKMVSAVYLFLISLLGLLMCFTTLYSLHEELAANYNLLLFNPIFLLVIYFLVRNNQKGIYRTGLLCVGMIGMYLILMLNKAHLLIVMPIVVCNLVVLGRLVIRSSSALRTSGSIS